MHCKNINSRTVTLKPVLFQPDCWLNAHLNSSHCLRLEWLHTPQFSTLTAVIHWNLLRLFWVYFKSKFTVREQKNNSLETGILKSEPQRDVLTRLLLHKAIGRVPSLWQSFPMFILSVLTIHGFLSLSSWGTGTRAISHKTTITFCKWLRKYILLNLCKNLALLLAKALFHCSFLELNAFCL